MNNEDFYNLLLRADRILQNCASEEQWHIAANYLNRLQIYLLQNHKRLRKTLPDAERLFHKIQHLQKRCDEMRASYIVW